INAELVEHAKRQRTMRNAVAIDRRLVARLSAAAAAELRQFRVDAGQRDQMRLEQRRVARPRTPAVDGQPQHAEKPRLAKVIAGERLAGPALSLRVEDEERRTLPRIQLRGTNEGYGHDQASTVEVGRGQLSRHISAGFWM